MTRTRKTNAWAGRAVRVCPTATIAGGRLHPHAGARGVVLDVRPQGGVYSVRLQGGQVINCGTSVLLPDGEPSSIHQWPALVERARQEAGATVPAYDLQQLPVTNATSRARYDGAELRAPLRPGATDNARLPSRVGSRLHHPCGRVTDLQGNPIDKD